MRSSNGSVAVSGAVAGAGAGAAGSMAKVIEIGVPIEELAERRERVLRAKRFEVNDRVPAIPALATRFLVPQVGVSFRDYYGDPETMLWTQILAQKWLMENIRTDAYSITGPWVGAWTDSQNTFEAGSLGCEVVFPEDDIPWAGAPVENINAMTEAAEGVAA